MKDIVEFLGIDILALQKTKKRILLNGMDTLEHMMLLRLAARHVDVQGFFEEDFVAIADFKLLNKKIYNGEEIGGSNDEYLLLDCKDKNTRGGDTLGMAI